MMRKIIAVLFIFLLIQSGKTQNITPSCISSAGDYFTTPTYSLSINLGEPIVESFGNTEALITTGFLQPSAANVRGNLSYLNASNSPMPSSIVKLMLNSQVVRTSNTDANGAFLFTDLLPGTYNFNCSTSLLPGSINAVDALLILKHFVQISTLTGLNLKAADVDGSQFISATDALLVARHFGGYITTFAAGDWQFDDTTFTIDNTGNYFFSLHGLCTGDVNASYIP